jgi:hypothetical protein
MPGKGPRGAEHLIAQHGQLAGGGTARVSIMAMSEAE